MSEWLTETGGHHQPHQAAAELSIRGPLTIKTDELEPLDEQVTMKFIFSSQKREKN